jgi:preprotein translocase subunit SecG
MATFILFIHILIAAALIGVVLLQRSEGGALGIGGGGGGGFMTGRGAGNFLTRATAGLAAAFFATSLFLSLIGARSEGPRSVLDAGKTTTTQPDKQFGDEGPGVNLPDSTAPDKKPDTSAPPKVPSSK